MRENQCVCIHRVSNHRQIQHPSLRRSLSSRATGGVSPAVETEHRQPVVAAATRASEEFGDCERKGCSAGGSERESGANLLPRTSSAASLCRWRTAVGERGRTDRARNKRVESVGLCVWESAREKRACESVWWWVTRLLNAQDDLSWAEPSTVFPSALCTLTRGERELGVIKCCYDSIRWTRFGFVLCRLKSILYKGWCKSKDACVRKIFTVKKEKLWHKRANCSSSCFSRCRVIFSFHKRFWRVKFFFFPYSPEREAWNLPPRDFWRTHSYYEVIASGFHTPLKGTRLRCDSTVAAEMGKKWPEIDQKCHFDLN